MCKQFAVLAVSVLALAACSDPTTSSGPARLAPIIDVSAANVQTQIIQDEFIIVLRTPPKGTSALVAELQGMQGVSGVQVLHVYGTALNGFAIKATPAALTALRANPNIDFVERNQIASAIATQTPATWGIDRIDQRNLPLTNSFTYPTGGAVIHIYIIDTGIRLTHSEFSGRMGNGYDAVTSGGNANDCNGHGTHVAGTTGGTTYGVTKNAVLHPVRVLDCGGSGSYAGVIAGINWVASNRIQPAVSNMSLGGPFSASVNNATNAMVSAGVVSAVAAGNDYGLNACNYSPASAVNALTVGSTTNTDARSSFSNIGTCLDIFAPGSSITSAWNSSDNATNTISGTSMASPHVAGAAALYRSFNPTHTTAQVEAALINNATLNVVAGAGTGSPNRLLYTGFIGGAPPPTNQLPVANFTHTCTSLDGIGADCTFDGTSSTDADGTIALYSWTATNRQNKTGPSVYYPLKLGSTVTVTLTVTDNAGGTNTKSQTFVVTVGSPPPPPPPPPPPTNQNPVADFTISCVTEPGGGFGRDCTFDGSSSSDPDGTIVSYSWTATNRLNKSGVSVYYPYRVGTTQTVTLTVTDNQGAANTKSVTFVVP